MFCLNIDQCYHYICLILESKNSDWLNNAMHHCPSLVRGHIKTRKKMLINIQVLFLEQTVSFPLSRAVKGKLGAGEMSTMLKAWTWRAWGRGKIPNQANSRVDWNLYVWHTETQELHLSD